MDVVGRQVRNAEQPPSVPVAPMGDVAVIVRVLWSDGLEEWRPARAVRWTSSHVMVGWRDEPAAGSRPATGGRAAATGGRAAAAGGTPPAAWVPPRPSERWVWLRAADVMRSVSWFIAPDRVAR